MPRKLHEITESRLLGSMMYVVLAICASLINSYSLSEVQAKSPIAVVQDLETLLLVFTGFSVLALGIQFVLAREIGEGRRAPHSLGFVGSLWIALLVLLSTFFSVNSSVSFRIVTAIIVSLCVFFILLPSGFFSSMLINFELKRIGLLLFSASLIRTGLWKTNWFSQDLRGLLIGILITNLFIYLIAFGINKGSHRPIADGIHWRKRKIAIGALIGFAVFIITGTVVSRGSFGAQLNEFSGTSLVGRRVLLVAIIFAYISFPWICRSALFTHELLKNFRFAQLATTLAALMFAIFTWLMESSSSEMRSFKSLLLVQLISWTLVSISLIPILFYVANNSKLGLMIYVPLFVMVIAQLVLRDAFMLSYFFLSSSFLLLVLMLIPAILRIRPVTRAESVYYESGIESNSTAYTVVVPSFNSGVQVIETIHKIYEAFSMADLKVFVIAVSDGSTDESVELLNRLDQSWFTHLQLPLNMGKGSALIEGFKIAQTNYVGFIDADGDIPPGLLPSMFIIAERESADVVFGSKWHPRSQVNVTTKRRLLSEVHHLLQVALFSLNIKDTQVGIKVYKTDSLRKILGVLTEKRFSLDLEIFVALRAHRLTRFIEMPVSINRNGPSTISVNSIIQTVLDMARIFWKSRVTLRYESLAFVKDFNEEGGL